MLAEFFRHVPIWVWPLLAALVALGWMQSRDRVVSVSRAMIAPAVLVPLSLYGVWSSFGVNAVALSAWALGLGLVVLLNATLLKTPRAITASADGSLLVHGSWLPMALILIIFSARFVLGATAAMAPQVVSKAVFIGTLGAVLGVCSGMFLAQAIRIIAQHRRISA